MLNFPRWKVILISLISLLGVLAAVPNFLDDKMLESWQSVLPGKQVTLGLDLQGGVHLLMEADLAEVKKEKLETKRGDIRDAMRKQKIRLTSQISSGQLTIRLKKAEETQAALAVVRDQVEILGGGITGGGVNDIDYEDMGNGVITVRLSEKGLLIRADDVIKQSIEVIRRRIDGMGTTEPVIQKQGTGRILIQVPGFNDPQKLKKIIGKTAKLSFQMVNANIGPGDRVPPGFVRLPMVESERLQGQENDLVVSKRAIITGENLVSASQGFDQNNNPDIQFRFDRIGGKKFGDVTRKNINRRFAIILDGEIISAPNIQSAILGGSGIITGNFTVQSANDLALLLRAGALPAKLTVMEERTVGPDLGADNIEAGKIASIIGLIAVMIYIVLSYGAFGMVTNFALIVNIALIFGILSTMNATLTLPGIAGIVLTIGMAVDANVLIFERIREELRSGKNVLSALDTGYQKAYGTIIDANVTTFIAAIFLFQFGSGPVKGFAVTLMVGIATSVFTAVSLTRLIIATWARKKRPTKLKI